MASILASRPSHIPLALWLRFLAQTAAASPSDITSVDLRPLREQIPAGEFYVRFVPDAFDTQRGRERREERGR